ncbi:hypothetical protein AALA69_00005 [Eggerthellaceae bacterium 24-137]
MTDLEERIRDAYDSCQLQDDVRERTLASIEAARAPEEGALGRKPVSPQTSGECAISGTPVLRSRRYLRRTRWLTAAACLLLVLAAFGAYGAYRTPSAYVDIDVNPAIELTVNPFGVVIGADALNDDGRAVLAGVSLLNRSYGDAIATLLASSAFSSYIDADAFVDINVVSEDDRLGTQIMAESDEAMTAVPAEHVCHRADADTRAAAAEAGLCIGRYLAAQELIELDPSYTMEDCASMSMRELHDHIDACHEKSEDGQSSDKYGAGKGHHHGRGAGHQGGQGRREE